MEDLNEYINNKLSWKECKNSDLINRNNVIFITYNKKIEFFIGKVLFSSSEAAGVRFYAPDLMEFIVQLKTGKMLSRPNYKYTLYIPESRFEDINGIYGSGHLKTCEFLVKELVNELKNNSNCIEVLGLNTYKYK